MNFIYIKINMIIVKNSKILFLLFLFFINFKLKIY